MPDNPDRHTLRGWARAFEIFADANPLAKFAVDCQHDEIYVADSRRVTVEQAAELESLGWRRDSENEAWKRYT